MRPDWLRVTILIVVATPNVLRAQAGVSVRGDLIFSGRYVWHGITRATGLLVQPSLAAGLRLGFISLEGGAVLHYELQRAALGVSELSTGDRGLGETDAWGRAAWDVGPARLQAGVLHYSFRDNTSLNTTEVFGAISATTKYARRSLEASWDVQRVHGVFLRGSVDLPVLSWPFPPYAFLFVDAEGGLNVGQRANYDNRGFTHAAAGIGVEVRAAHLGSIGWAALAAGLRSQLNFDAATRFAGADRSRDIIAWGWTGVTVLLGQDARDAR